MREPLTTEQVLNIGEQCLAGLATAHNHGVLHCDLKPENLMITRDGLVKILDFGFARPDESETTKDSVDLTCPGSLPRIGGSPGYMVPEVLLGTMPDKRSDIFSLGVVLYEAVAGFHPFREPNRAIADCILRNEPRRLPGPVPAHLDLVLLHMLAKDPAHRYQSCADALADLQAVRANEKPALGQARQTRRRRSLAKILPLVGAAILAMLLLSWPARPPVRQVAASSRQLAVLPFQTASGDESSRAFARGLAETLAANLGQISDHYPLEVVPASEVRGHTVMDAQQARSVLGANLALEGSLQQSRDTVRVTYSLLDTRSLRQLHSGVITADASNPFAVQDRVIAEVLNNLNIDLAKEDRGLMASHGTTQPQAYDAYLRGHGYLQEYDRAENLDNAIAAFQQILKADPQFALAYAGLDQAYLQKYAIAKSPESVTQAQDACPRPAQLDTDPDGEICLGM